jgi:toxin YoeB
MGKYFIETSSTAKKQLALIYKSGDKSSIKKIERIFEELEEHPTTGVGNPEALKHDMLGQWSRRINEKDRLIY